MYDLTLSKNTIWQLMVNFKNTLFYYRGSLKKAGESRTVSSERVDEIKELQRQRRGAAKELLAAVADHKEDLEPEFGYLSTLVEESEEE